MVFEVLKSVGALSALTGLLALLLVLAERFLADFGECTITINTSKQITVPGGGHLLGTLVDKGIFIPSACGGRSTCGYCKVKVLSGAGPMLPMEEPHLSAEEVAEGTRLSCCVRVRNDIEIEIPETILSLREYDTIVERIRDLTYDIKEIRLAIQGDQPVRFKAGQYAQFKIPAYGANPEPIYRAYSISSSPSDDRALEFVIRLVPSGVSTTYIFEHLKEGQPFSVNGPYGDFFLRDSDAEIVFIAGSTGIAPIKSILHSMVERGIKRKARFFFGAVQKRDLLYVEEMSEFERRLPNFQYIPALSKKDPEDQWDGEEGLITEVLARHLQDGINAEAYLCGSPGMIDACVKVLMDKAIAVDNIFYDKFA